MRPESKQRCSQTHENPARKLPNAGTPVSPQGAPHAPTIPLRHQPPERSEWFPRGMQTRANLRLPASRHRLGSLTACPAALPQGHPPQDGWQRGRGRAGGGRRGRPLRRGATRGGRGAGWQRGPSGGGGGEEGPSPGLPAAGARVTGPAGACAAAGDPPAGGRAGVGGRAVPAGARRLPGQPPPPSRCFAAPDQGAPRGPGRREGGARRGARTAGTPPPASAPPPGGTAHAPPASPPRARGPWGERAGRGHGRRVRGAAPPSGRGRSAPEPQNRGIPAAGRVGKTQIVT